MNQSDLEQPLLPPDVPHLRRGTSQRDLALLSNSASLA